MTLSFDDVADILAVIDTCSGDNLTIEIAGGTLTVTRRRNDASTVREGDALAVAASEIIRAPTLGFLRASPEPGAPPFVTLGGQVVAGQPLCTIDVLGRLTTVCAAAPGCITHVDADDGALVEYGQPLFAVHPDASR